MSLAEELKQKHGSKYDGVNKVVLAYSGGLDTSVMVKLLKEVCGAEVVTVTLSLDGEEYSANGFDKMEEKAISLGALKHYTFESKKEFVDEYIAKAIKANGLYQGAYPLSTTIQRPLVVKHLVEVAEKEGADAIAHGATGKGNDQVRFDIGIKSLDHSLKIIAPVRDWDLKRDEEIEYAKHEGIALPVSAGSPYSIDANMWGRSIECGILEQPHEMPPEDVFEWTVLPEKAPDSPELVKVFFEKGIPVKVESNEGVIEGLESIVPFLNKLGGEHGVGALDSMEDRVVGLKTREVYECPAATVLLTAHKELEKLVFTKEENEFKPVVDKLWSEQVYKGLWFSPLTKSLNAFVDSTQEHVSGWVKLKLYKGQAKVVARYSDYALYDYGLASYNKDTTFDQTHSIGFISLHGLNTVLANKVRK